MPLDSDRPINRAVVVGWAISATRNYLKFTHVTNIKTTLVQRSCRNAEGVKAFLPDCHLSKQ
jgi:hypothetical protein